MLKIISIWPSCISTTLGVFITRWRSITPLHSISRKLCITKISCMSLQVTAITKPLKSSGNRGLDTFAHDRRYEILYNLGYQLLLTGKPDLAFDSFQECGKMFFKQPKYWLKVAECCIAAHMRKVNCTLLLLTKDRFLKVHPVAPFQCGTLQSAVLTCKGEQDFWFKLPNLRKELNRERTLLSQPTKGLFDKWCSWQF